MKCPCMLLRLLPLFILALSSLAFAAPTISLSQNSATASMPGGPCSGNPSNQTVTISNSGSGTLTYPGQYPTTTYSSGATGWLDATISGSSAPYTMTLQFQNTCTGISDGTYTATVSIASSGASNSPVSFPVTLIVGSSSSPTISLSPTTLTFSATADGPNPASKNVTVSDSGGGTLGTPTTSITYGSGASGWLATTVSGSSAPYTISNQVTTGSLNDGTYTATVDVASSGASNTPMSYSVSFTVSSSGAPTISLSQDNATANMPGGPCSGNPANQTVTISNSGGGTLAYPGEYPTTTYSSGASGWLDATVSGSSAPYTMTLQFQNTCGGISDGTYTATVSIASTGASNSPVSFPVTLNVGSSGSSPAISLAPGNLDFSTTIGGSNPAVQNVTASNSGGGTLGTPTTSITYGSGASGWLMTTVSGSSAPYAIANQVTSQSLSAGTYTATVDVADSGATNTPVSYIVTVNVTSGSVCTLNSPSGDSDSCGPYSYPEDTEANGSNTYVGMDFWNPQSGDSQTLYATNPGDWYVTFNAPAGQTVLTFPNTEQLYNSEPLDSFSALYASFSESNDESTNTSADIGFDNWFNNWGNEVMIQHNMVNRGGQCGPVLTTQTFGGTNGVPVNTWVLCQYGSELIWQIKQPAGNPGTFGFQSGSVDILAMNKWLEANGYLPANSTITVISYGFEITGTNGTNENFGVNSFSITNN